MNAHWQKIAAKTVVWITAEVLLNLLGLDNLADYGEFVFERHASILAVSPGVEAIAPPGPVFQFTV